MSGSRKFTRHRPDICAWKPDKVIRSGMAARKESGRAGGSPYVCQREFTGLANPHEHPGVVVSAAGPTVDRRCHGRGSTERSQGAEELEGLTTSLRTRLTFQRVLLAIPGPSCRDRFRNIN
jgi:hypothetical protein